jgi:hypothetical protein
MVCKERKDQVSPAYLKRGHGLPCGNPRPVDQAFDVNDSFEAVIIR